MHHRNHGGWGSFLWVFATGIGLARLFGWPWDKIWRHHLGWLVILYAAMLGLRLRRPGAPPGRGALVVAAGVVRGLLRPGAGALPVHGGLRGAVGHHPA